MLVILDTEPLVVLLDSLDNWHDWAREQFAVPFRIGEQGSSVEKLLLKYADVPISLADACLLRMSELLDDSIVLTLDSDFTVYRRHGRQNIPLIYPR